MTQKYRTKIYFSVLILYFIYLHLTQCFTVSQDVILFKKKFPYKKINNIVGKNSCEIVNHPYVVSIHDIYYKLVCGGSLLNHRWVLTAAHCCKKRLSYGDYTVYAGISSLTRLTGRKSVVKYNYRHPHYDPKNLVNDIGLMSLETPIFQSNVIGYIKIPVPENGKVTSLCDKGLVMGFGLENILIVFGPPNNPYSEPYKPNLHCIELEVVTDPKKCLKYNAKLFGGKQFCTFSSNNGTDACKSDSGGPFICDEIQIGIASGKDGCGLKGFAGTYTNLQEYSDFIEKTISVATNLKLNFNSFVWIFLYFSYLYSCVLSL